MAAVLSLVGNVTTVPGSRYFSDIAGVSSTRSVGILDDDTIVCYDHDGTDWSQTGNTRATQLVTLGGISVMSVSGNTFRVALAGSFSGGEGNGDGFKVYDFDGTDFTLYDTDVSWFIDDIDLLNTTGTIDFIGAARDAGGLIDEFRFLDPGWDQTESWDVLSGFGSDISVVANSLNAGAAIDNGGGGDTRLIRLVETSIWAQDGTALTLGTGGTLSRIALGAFDDTDVFLYNQYTGQLEVYSWDSGGSEWLSASTLAVTVTGDNAGDTLSSTELVLVDAGSRIAKYQYVEVVPTILNDNDVGHSALLTVKWDWTTESTTGRWSTSQQAIKPRRYHIPTSSTTPTYDGFGVLRTRLRVRGRGESAVIRYESEDGKDFQLLGWSIPFEPAGD